MPAFAWPTSPPPAPSGRPSLPRTPDVAPRALWGSPEQYPAPRPSFGGGGAASPGLTSPTSPGPPPGFSHFAPPPLYSPATPDSNFAASSTWPGPATKASPMRPSPLTVPAPAMPPSTSAPFLASAHPLPPARSPLFASAEASAVGGGGLFSPRGTHTSPSPLPPSASLPGLSSAAPSAPTAPSAADTEALRKQLRANREWIDRTNKPHPPPGQCSSEVRRLMELGAADLTVANYPRAAESYRAAASQPTGHCPEVWDNVALACLLARDPGGCVVAAATCTALHPAFFHAYLHSARAYQLAGDLGQAMRQLQAALTCAAAPQVEPLIREMQLLGVEEPPPPAAPPTPAPALAAATPKATNPNAGRSSMGPAKPTATSTTAAKPPASAAAAASAAAPDGPQRGAGPAPEKPRSAAEEEQRRQREAQRSEEAMRRHVHQNLDLDAAWQARTNKPQTLSTWPVDLQRLAQQGAQALTERDWPRAEAAFRRALALPAGRCKEMLDNCALACLLGRRDTDCVALASEALQLDPRYVPALLHRARAHRCLRDFTAAVRDLQAVVDQRTSQAPDATREIQAIALEQRDRELNCESPRNYLAVLGVAPPLDRDQVAAQYKALAMKWHPDKWVSASAEEQQNASAQFQLINEANAVLSDPEQQQQWLATFCERERLRYAPHLRTFAAASPEVTPRPAPKRTEEDRKQEEEARKAAEARRARTLQEEARRRQAASEDRAREEARKVHEERRRALLRRVDLDSEWQERSNRPHRTPAGCPEVVRVLVDIACGEMEAGEHRRAYDHFRQALEYRGGVCREVLDNCAVAALLCRENAECIQHATQCIALDPAFPYGYLHRARAYRCVAQLEAAVKDLTAALELKGPLAADITRELSLLTLEQRDRELGCPSPRNYLEVLGVSPALDLEAIAAQYKALNEKWQPSKWATASLLQRQTAAAQLQLVGEAYAVLGDPARQREWLEAFKEREKVRRAPHVRVFQPQKDVANAAALEEARLEDLRLAEEERKRQQDCERVEKELQRQQLMAEEQERRQAAAQERLREEQQRHEEEQRRLLNKKIDMDVEWQARSNRPNKLPPTVPDGAQVLNDMGAAELLEHRFEAALEYFAKASQAAEGKSAELLDNCAIAALLLRADERCVQFATQALALDAALVPPYLHRARAHRCLRQYDAAAADLNAVLALKTPHHADVVRELALLAADREAHEARPDSPQNLAAVLGVSKTLEPAEIEARYTEVSKKWRPEAWARKPPAERKWTAAELQKATEAYAVLRDTERRGQWRREWEERERVTRLPHARFFCPWDPPVRNEEENRRLAEQRQRQQQKYEAVDTEKRLQEEQKRREALMAEREREEQVRAEEEHRRLLNKKIDMDVEWQARSNRPNKLPPTVPDGAQVLNDMGAAELLEHRFEAALEYFTKASQAAEGKSAELLDNCAIAALLLRADERCVQFATQALALDTALVPPYLHRARAHRGLRQYDAAAADLNAVLALKTPHHADVVRELALLAMDREAHEARPDSPRNLAAVLGVSKTLEPAEIEARYAEVARHWRPEAWVRKPPPERKWAAAELQKATEAYNVLRDADKRAQWRREWEERERVTRLPHARFFCPWDPPVHTEEERRRLAEQRQRQQQKYEAERRLQEERKRREALMAEREREEQARAEEEHRRLLNKKIDMDVEWQARSNRPNKLPPAVLDGAQELNDMGAAELLEHRFEAALEYFAKASQAAEGKSAELLDNCAIAALLLRADERCVQFATQALALDAALVPPYLHRARAHRCLRQYDAAAADLNAVLALKTPHHADVVRELALLVMDREAHEARPDSPRNLAAVLGVSKALDPVEIETRYAELSRKWRPEAWARKPPAERKWAAAELQKATEAYAVLRDAARRGQWQRGWEERERVTRLPHARFFCPWDPPVHNEEERRRLAEERALQKYEAEKRLREEQRRRDALMAERDREEQARAEEDQRRILHKKIDLDVEWQARSNRPHKPPASLPSAARLLVEMGAADLAEHRFEAALGFFQQAAQLPGGRCVELLDNCAIAALLARQDEKCVQHATDCLALDPTFVFAYVHRARGLRVQQKYDAALQDLKAAAAQPNAPGADIAREASLVAGERDDRRATPQSPRNHLRVLGLPKTADAEQIAARYRTLTATRPPSRKGRRSAEGTPTEEQRQIQEAYEVLQNPERRAQWQQEFEERERVRRPPHARFFGPWDPPLRNEEERRRLAEERQAAQQKFDRTVAEERGRRQTVAAERQREQERRQEEERQRVWRKKLEADADWQARSNRPQRAPASCPAEVQQFAETGLVAMVRQQWQEALAAFVAAAQHPQGRGVRELLDACAIAALLLGRNEEALKYANACLSVDPAYWPAYLHRARARRALRQLDFALEDLRAAEALTPPNAPDIAREASLIQAEREDRVARPESPRNYARILGVGPALEDAEVQSRFRTLSEQLQSSPGPAAGPSHPPSPGYHHRRAPTQPPAALQLELVKEAYAVLGNPQRKAMWREAYAESESVRRAPHARFFAPLLTSPTKQRGPRASSVERPAQTPRQPPVPVASPPASPAPVDLPAPTSTPASIPAPAPAPPPAVPSAPSAVPPAPAGPPEEAARAARHSEWKRTFEDTVALDWAWQERSNRLHRVPPPGGPPSAAVLPTAALADLTAGWYSDAVGRLQAACQQLGSEVCPEALDNVAVAALWARDDAVCVQYATRALEMDPHFVPALLHRARARRHRLQLPEAVADLTAAAVLAEPLAADLKREIWLIEVEQRQRATGQGMPPDYFALLGLSRQATEQETEQLRASLAALPDPGPGAAPATTEARKVFRDPAAWQKWVEHYRRSECVFRPPHARLFPPPTPDTTTSSHPPATQR